MKIGVPEQNKNLMQKRFPEENGIECLSDIQFNIMDYMINRNINPLAENDLCFVKNSADPLSKLSVFQHMTKIQKMLVYGEKSASHCMTFMKHDKKIAVGTSKGTIVSINLNDYMDGLRELKAYRTVKKVHELSINAMRMNRRGDLLITGDKGGTVKYFKTKILYENQQIQITNTEDPDRHLEAIRDLAFSPNSAKCLTCSDDKTLRIGDLATGMVEKVFYGHGSDITSSDWHPTMSLIASGGKDRILKMWDARESEELCSLYNHTNSICKVRFSECGSWLLTCGRDQTVRLFDVRHMERELNAYKMHDRDVLSVAWNPAQEGVFASGDSVGAVSVCSVMCKKPLAMLNHETKVEVWDIAWNNMGNMLATCGGDRLINLFTPNQWIPNYFNKEMAQFSQSYFEVKDKFKNEKS